MMHLNVFVMATEHHEPSWRLPESDPRASIGLARYQNLARIAEDAAFDSPFQTINALAALSPADVAIAPASEVQKATIERLTRALEGNLARLAAELSGEEAP